MPAELELKRQELAEAQEARRQELQLELAQALEQQIIERQQADITMRLEISPTPEAAPGFIPPDPTRPPQSGLELVGEVAAKAMPQFQLGGGLVQEAFAPKTLALGPEADIIPQVTSEVPGAVGAIGSLFGPSPQYVDPGIEFIKGIEAGTVPTIAGTGAPELSLGEVPARPAEERGIALTIASALGTAGQLTGAGIQATKLAKRAPTLPSLSKVSFRIGDEIITPKGKAIITGVTDEGVIGRIADKPGSHKFKFSELGEDVQFSRLGVSAAEKVIPDGGDVLHFEGLDDSFTVVRVEGDKAFTVNNINRQVGSFDITTGLDAQGRRVVGITPAEANRAALRRAMREGMGEPVVPAELPVVEAIEREQLGTGLETVTNGVRALKQQLITPVVETIRSMGPTGEELAGLIDDFARRAELGAGVDIADMKIALAKLSENEKLELLFAKIGVVKTENPEVLSALDVIGNILDRIEQSATQLGIQVIDSKGRIRPFVGRENYFPIHIDPRKLYRLKKTAEGGKVPVFREKVIQKLVSEAKKKGRDLSEAEAAAILERYIRPNMKSRHGSLERSRELDALELITGGFADTNVERVLTRYLEGAHMTLEKAVAFGVKEEKLDELLLALERAGHDRTFVGEAMARILGKDVDHTAITRLARVAKSTQVITKLGLAQITNLGQSANPIITKGLVNYLKGIRKIMRSVPDAKDFALRSSAILDQTTRELLEAYGAGDRISRGFLKYTGFTAVENFNRVVSAHTGVEWLKSTAIKMQRGSIKGKRLQKHFKELGGMGIKNPRRFVEHGEAAITQSDKLHVGKAVSDSTQFRVRPQDLPLFWSSPLGQVLTQFKTFAFSHYRLVTQEVIRDPRKIARAVITTQVIGTGIGTVKSLVRGKDPRERRVFENFEPSLWNNIYVDNVLTLGGIGIMTDTLESAMLGQAALVSQLAGPSVGEIAGITADITQLVQGRPKPIAKRATRAVPVVGQAATRFLFP